MKARLYLGEITQDRIRASKFSERPAADLGWVLCCDGFCCILNFKRELDDDLPDVERPSLAWQLREEPFGGLLWNTGTGHVFQLDQTAYRALRELAEGASVNELAKRHNVEESELYTLLAEVTTRY